VHERDEHAPSTVHSVIIAIGPYGENVYLLGIKNGQCTDFMY